MEWAWLDRAGFGWVGLLPTVGVVGGAAPVFEDEKAPASASPTTAPIATMATAAIGATTRVRVLERRGGFDG